MLPEKSHSVDNAPLFYLGAPSGLLPKSKSDSQRDHDNNPIIATEDGNRVASDLTAPTPLFKASSSKSIHLALNIDTEFYTPNLGLRQSSRVHLSSQVRCVKHDARYLFFHPTNATILNEAREKDGLSPVPVLQTECDAFDYLNQEGINVTYWRNGEETKDIPTLYITFYAHFAVAELNLIFRGELKREIKQLQRTGKVTQQRVLRASSTINDYKADFIYTSFVVELDSSKHRKYNGRYKLAIRFIDTSGLHGTESYAGIAKNVGHELKYKDLLSKEEKGDMLNTALNKPLQFEQYALGDLDVSDILEKYIILWKEIYEQLGIKQLFREPKLTIGGTIKDLFEAVLAENILGQPDKKTWLNDFRIIADKYLKSVSPLHLKEEKSTVALLAHVQGGRCRNAQGDIVHVIEAIADIDISGCYGEGQRNQIYPIGKPEIWSYRHDCVNHFPSLLEWLKSYEVKFKREKKDGRLIVTDWGELINGCWYGVVSSEELSYPQDLIESRVTPSGEYKSDILAKFLADKKSDTECDHSSVKDNYGSLKMFHHEIKNGVLTHDLLQIIIDTSSIKQQRELLKKIRVVSSMVYPRSQRVSSAEELEANNNNWSKKTVVIRKKDKDNSPYFLRIERECHAWYGINMGDLIVDELLINRKKAQINDGKKSPKDQLFKLSVNTLYGDLVSPYFLTSNPCVGNNITARARALAWCMEKGLNLYQVITDGGTFDINRVNYSPSFNPQAEKKLRPLGGLNINQEWTEREYVSVDSVGGLVTKKAQLFKITQGEKIIAERKIIAKGEEQIISEDYSQFDELAWNHLAELFASLDIFSHETTRIVVKKEGDKLVTHRLPRKGMFNFETKSFFVEAVFHGSANYLLIQGDGKETIKARGYENRLHQSWEMVDNELVESNYYEKDAPFSRFLKGIRNDTTRLIRQKVATKSSILKLKAYAKNAGKYDDMGLEPGDNLIESVLISEFSLSQFTFLNWEQWHNWSSSIERAKSKGKQSIEGFFLNKDGTLNYQGMISWVNGAIAKGMINPIDELDTNRHRVRDEKDTHPAYATLQAVRKQLELPFVQCEENAENMANWQAIGQAPQLYWGKPSSNKTDPLLSSLEQRGYKRRTRKTKTETADTLKSTTDPLLVSLEQQGYTRRKRKAS